MTTILSVSTPAKAQDAAATPAQEGRQDTRPVGAAAALTEEIIVTATKRAEDVQDVPLAVTAFGNEQLEALNFRDVGSLSFTMPNVALDDNGTSKGYANFSIRGVGINSSIPSIDPTVGVFVDGVYQGINAGQVFDNFDLEAIEVLRGPQGVLFGRNVTGGAVLVRTRKPGDKVEFRGRVAAETGPRMVADASVSGPLIDGKLGAKIAAYYTYDDGWFTNLFDGSSYGKDRQFIVRPMLRFTPSASVEMLLRLEHGTATGDGPPTQNHALYSRQSHDFLVNTRGFYNNRWDQATFETNIDVGFGNGTITNIAAWRRFKGDTLSDLDGVNTIQFNIGTYTDQEQFSEELRYAGTFGRFEPTVGLYYFTQDLTYLEDRTLAGGAVRRAGGGTGTFDTFGAFAAVDWHITDALTLNVGGRYTRETKKVSIATVRTGGADYLARTLVPDFNSSAKWSDFSPRVGVQWQPSTQTQLYAFYAKGFRSGGYNFRNTLVGAAPGPFNSETQDAYEVGLKQKFGRLGNVNLAVFQNTIDDIQREVQVPVVGVGIAQLIQNVGTARIRGFEGEVQFVPVRNLVLAGQFGYTDGVYRSLSVDLNGDGVINAADFALKLPRQSPWTYGASATLDIPLRSGVISARGAYSHRDRAFHTDNNLGFYTPVDLVDVNLSYTPEGGAVTFSLYGKNITNETMYGNDAVLPDTAAFGGDGPSGPRPLPTFSPLSRGRVWGGEVRFKF
ncbi:TonB-dependent receptor [Sphingomonas floccifaciens]|uniref:TonB-dependent receptor n=1 Tax=Sphingomonas floccifaciens TaxID=1844115 RepID=A0ABW4NHK8_9SPHN